MSSYLHGETSVAFMQRRSLQWRALLNGVTDLVRICYRRRRQRRELLDYMASDHRVAADIGITGYEARNWSQRPFWRA
jgi:uncharacterized protein YjiS (DUF1127 family)